MACKKYTLTNGTASTQTFSYQECSNNMWLYDVLLEPGQTKTIWFVNTTFQSYYTNSITIVDDGAFPPTPSASAIAPSPTPTPSVTPTKTATPTVTPSVTPSLTVSITPTQTPTPTNIVRTRLSSICHDESDPGAVCDCLGTATLFVNGTDLSDSTLAWSDETGVNTGDPVGFYTENGTIYEVAADCGVGCISGSTISVYGNCPTPTPTPTSTITPTPTPTPTPTIIVSPSVTPTNTVTPTITPSQTPTFNFVVSNTNTGGAYVQGVTGTTGTVITKSGYSYPVNSGETLYSDFTNSGGNLQFDVEIKDPSSADFQLIIKTNGSITDTFTPGPGDFTANVGPYTVIDSDVIQVILENI